MKKMFDKIFRICHPELVSGSHQPEMLNIVDLVKSLLIKRFSMTYLRKTIAFTLAETLVVMGIIGVVAALTIPNLNQSTGDREKVAKVKKVYSNLEDAFGRATAVYGPADEWCINFNEYSKDCSQRLADRMTEFMKVSKICESEETACFAYGSYVRLDGKNYSVGDGYVSNSKVLLADGAALDFYLGTSGTGWVYVDIDGPKGSNTAGKDYFQFEVTSTGIIPAGGKNSSYNFGETNEKLTAYCFTYGTYCTAWVIETGNMDYLKATKGKCPNGTQLTWENTSCK